MATTISPMEQLSALSMGIKSQLFVLCPLQILILLQRGSEKQTGGKKKLCNEE